MARRSWRARAGIAVGAFGLMVLASLYRTATLARGGGHVARSLGGTRVSGEGNDPLQRRLVNVVEEMALASGLPVPEIYVLEQESAINAFAAGRTSADAAIAVTRGALERLERNELQGVIAHEFSHILNGDMRLNQQLIGLSFGILVLSLVGRWLLRSIRYRTTEPRAQQRRRCGGACDRRRPDDHRRHWRAALPDHQSRRVAAAREAGRRVGRAVHARTGRARRRAEENRRLLGAHRVGRHRGGRPHDVRAPLAHLERLVRHASSAARPDPSAGAELRSTRPADPGSTVVGRADRRRSGARNRGRPRPGLALDERLASRTRRRDRRSGRPCLARGVARRGPSCDALARGKPAARRGPRAVERRRDPP